MASENSSSSYALAIAISAMAAIALFWALVLAAVLLGQGSLLVQATGATADAPRSIKITDVTGGLTALFALAVAAGSLWLTRRHNRLSVRPKISVVWVVKHTENSKRGLYLRNHGLGPALIDEISFEVMGGPVLRSYENLLLFIFANNKYSFYQGDLGCYWLELLPKDACERLLWLESNQAGPSDQFRKLILDLRLIIRYQSFYGEKEIEIFDPKATPKEEPLDPMSLFIDPKS